MKRLFNTLLRKKSYSHQFFISKSFATKHKTKFPKEEDFIKNTSKEKEYPEDDLIFDIKQQEKFRGMLIICPTPIGNLNDISLRQYEAIKTGDILACEDTRVTARLLELLTRKKMKEQFIMEFGISIEEFVNKGGMDMNDERIEEMINSKKESRVKEKSKENDKSYDITNDITNDNPDGRIGFYEFYKEKDDLDKIKNIDNKLKEIDERLKKQYKNTVKQNEEMSYGSVSMKDINEIEKRLNVDYSFKVKENTYDYIKDEEDFKIKQSQVNKEEFDEIEEVANDFYNNKSISYKLKTKAKYIMGVNRNFYSNQKQNDNETNETEEEVDLETGLEDNSFTLFTKRIKDEKAKKGRGILFSYRREIEDNASSKLIKAMKLGLKVVLISDAGTPTISDPGYKLIKKCVKEGINIESLPGACAAITALACSGMPTENFYFIGYLSKQHKERLEKLSQIKKYCVTGIIYESSKRLSSCLSDLKEVFGENHEVYIGNELTKLHESNFYGKVNEVIERINKLNSSEETYLRGECTIVVAPFKRIYTESEQLLNEMSLNMKEEVNIVECGRRLDEEIKVNTKELKDLLYKLFGISKLKAERIAEMIKKEKKRF